MNRQEIDNTDDIAEFLKRRRHELRVTQKTLATFCNLSHNGISRIEIAESDVKLSTLLKMSKILGFKIIVEFES